MKYLLLFLLPLMLMGDINQDERISITDYTLLRLHIVGAQTLSIDELQRADINNDGYADQADLELIRSIILEDKPMYYNTCPYCGANIDP